VGQKRNSPFLRLRAHNLRLRSLEINQKVDLGILAAIAMLVVWAIITFVVNDAPGVTHALLTAGVALLVWRVVNRSEPPRPPTPPAR
jgi:hypothetical protein